MSLSFIFIALIFSQSHPVYDNLLRTPFQQEIIAAENINEMITALERQDQNVLIASNAIKYKPQKTLKPEHLKTKDLTDYVSLFIIFTEQQVRNHNEGLKEKLRARGFSNTSFQVIIDYLPGGADVLGKLYRSRVENFINQQEYSWLNLETKDVLPDPDKVRNFLIREKISKRVAEHFHLANFLLALNPKDRLIFLSYLADKYKNIKVNYQMELEPTQSNISDFYNALQNNKASKPKGN